MCLNVRVQRKSSLGLFKITLPHKILVFVVWHLKLETDIHVRTKTKLDKQLAGQSPTPYMSLTHTSEKYRSFKFDEYKLLENQTDRLSEAIDKMDTRPQGKQNRFCKPYIPRCRGRGYRNYPSFYGGFYKNWGNIRQGHIIETEEGTPHSEADPEATIIQEGHTEDKAIIEIEVTVVNEGIKVSPDYWLGLPVKIKTDVSFSDSLVILPKIVPKRTLLQANCSTGKKTE